MANITSTAWSFGKSTRNGKGKDKVGPDPGSYDVSGKGIVTAA